MQLQETSLCSVIQNVISEQRIDFIYSYHYDENAIFIILANDKNLVSDGIDQKAFLIEATDDTHDYYLSILLAEEWFDLTTELSNCEGQYVCYGKETINNILLEIGRILTTYTER